MCLQPPADDRLLQAKKVQQVGHYLTSSFFPLSNIITQLLEALKQPQGGESAPAASTPAPPPMMPPAPGMPPYYGGPPLPPYLGGPPPPTPGFPPNMPPQPPVASAATAPPPAAPGVPGLPPNILALLQQSGQTHSQQSTPPPQAATPQFSMPPQAAPAGQPPAAPPGAPNGQGGYQQLMAYLVSCYYQLT